ncbi:MAG: peptidylprolyl isomerase [Bacteroidales bacterium]
MRYRLTIIFSLLLPAGVFYAQELNDRILMVVDGRNISAGEFIRMYKKTFSPGDLYEFDQYLDQFTVFKLKVAEAIREGYDTTKAFKTELASYREQLSRNLLTDNEAKNNVLRKAYERSLKEINAWHILVACPPESSAEDTLASYNKAVEIKARIVSGEPFEQVARSVSDDPSVRYNGGNLGYFTAFQMITPLEDAVYSMKKGEISDPVKTPYGYHIIKVADIRPSKGKVKVAHIMRSVSPDAPEKEVKAAEDTINYVYKQLLSGASFADLARKYSNHKESALRGGELNWFGAGEIVTEFIEAALALKNNGDFTPPVRTVYGWHIIKRIDKREPPSFEEAKPEIESKINESWLNSIVIKSLVEKLRKEYGFRLNIGVFNWFKNNTDTLIIRGLAKYDRKSIPQEPVYTFANQKFSGAEFAKFIESKASPENRDEPGLFVDKSIETCITDHILRYENSVLETKYPDFRYLMNEFHDGILLFEISEKKVWDRVQSDSAGMKKYYETNKNKYMSKKAFEGALYIFNNKDKPRKFYSAFTRYSNHHDLDEKLRKKFSGRNYTGITVNKGLWQEGDTILPGDLKWQRGTVKTNINGYPAVIAIETVHEPEPLPFSQIQGEIMSEYQEYIESEWVRQLKEKYPVKLNNDVLEEVKKRLKNE